MGCGKLSKLKKSHSLPILLYPRISKGLKRGETLSTDRDFLSRKNTNKLKQMEEKICLKFKIFEEFCDIIPQEMDPSEESNSLAVQYTKDIKFIKKAWVLYHSAISYFELITHGGCIEDFKITDGLIIVLISNIASKKKLDIDILLSIDPPFFQFSSSASTHRDTNELNKAWENLSNALIKFTMKKMVKLEDIGKRFTSLYEEYQCYNLSEPDSKDIRKSLKNIMKLMDSIEKLIKDITHCKQLMKDFVETFKLRKTEIISLGEKALSESCYSGEHIVHYILTLTS